jgi:hypothetical protein
MSSKDALSVGIGENVFVSVATDAVNMRMLDLGSLRGEARPGSGGALMLSLPQALRALPSRSRRPRRLPPPFVPRAGSFGQELRKLLVESPALALLRLHWFARFGGRRIHLPPPATYMYISVNRPAGFLYWTGD